MTKPSRHLNAVSEDQLLVKLSCGHQVRVNNDFFDHTPANQVPAINCEDCDREMINGLPAVDIRKHYSNVVGVKEIDSALSHVLSGVPFIMFDRIVYVSIEKSREFNCGQ